MGWWRYEPRSRLGKGKHRKSIEYTEDHREEYIIPAVDSEQWSNITIRKKSKKKSYKFWQTPIDGKDVFGSKSTEVKDKIEEYSIPQEVETFLKDFEIQSDTFKFVKQWKEKTILYMKL